MALQPNEQRFQVLAALTRLRQLACHPRLCDATFEGSSSKLTTLIYLDGQTPPKQHERLVDAYQKGETSISIISFKAGGTGLNLTGADCVIQLHPWWNPAVEDQATDRAHRIGQTRPVTVYRLVAEGTIEEQILALHDDQRDLVAGVLEGSGEAARLSTDERLTLIRAGTSGAPPAIDDSDDEG